MITGAHSIIYSKNPEADRAFLRDVVGLTHVDVGHGWLIFGLPPAEVAVHPSEKNDLHELYLMCDDVEALIASLSERAVVCGPVQNLGWGALTSVTLPGGGKLGIYEPRHARPQPMGAPRARRRVSSRPKRKPAKKAGARTRSKPGRSRARRGSARKRAGR